MKTNHTPGPWRRYGRRIEYGPMVAGDGFLVATISRDPKESEGNARLIAAAPELLSSLKLACEVLRGTGECGIAKDLEKTIAKAEGKD